MVVNVKKHNSLDIDEKQEKCSTVQLDVTNFTSKCVFIVSSFKKYYYNMKVFRP